MIPQRYRPWFPRDLPGVAAYYSAEVATLVAGAVSSWTDTGGSGDAARNATQTTAGLRPTLTASDVAYGKRPVLAFGAAAFLQTGVWSVALAQPSTIYVVGEAPTDLLGHTFLDGIVGGAQQSVISTAGFPGTFLTEFAGAFLFAGGLATGPRVMCVVFAGASSAIYVGDATTPATTGNAGAMSATGFTVGCVLDGLTQPLGPGGKVAALSAFSGAHGHADRSRVMTYYGAQYSLPVTP